MIANALVFRGVFFQQSELSIRAEIHIVILPHTHKIRKPQNRHAILRLRILAGTACRLFLNLRQPLRAQLRASQ